MIYFRDTTDFYMEGPTAVTLGKFDGLHRGHQKLLSKVMDLSRGNISSVVFTLNAKKESLILTEKEQKELIDQMGITCLIKCPFVPEIFRMTPENFVDRILTGALHACAVVVGTDFRFGYQRAGDAAFLKECEKKYPFKVHIIEKEKYNEREISSTYVREALAQGDVELAGELMGRAYSIEGTVVHGAHLGTKMGMPTANLIPDAAKLLPPNGVYFSTAETETGVYPGITNVGRKPTVNGTFTGVETHLLNVNPDLYGKVIKVNFRKFVRPERKFSSLEQLKEQMQADIRKGREYFGEHSGLEV